MSSPQHCNNGWGLQLVQSRNLTKARDAEGASCSSTTTCKRYARHMPQHCKNGWGLQLVQEPDERTRSKRGDAREPLHRDSKLQ